MLVQLRNEMVALVEDSLTEFNVKDLVEIYNQVASRSIKGWSKSKSELIGRIVHLADAADVDNATDDSEPEGETPDAEAPEGETPDATDAKAEAKAAKAAKAAEAKAAKAAKAKKNRKTPQWVKLLNALAKAGAKGLSRKELAKRVDTNENSISCYTNYLMKGVRGYPVASIRREKAGNESVYFLEEEVQAVVDRKEAMKEQAA